MSVQVRGPGIDIDARRGAKEEMSLAIKEPVEARAERTDRETQWIGLRDFDAESGCAHRDDDGAACDKSDHIQTSANPNSHGASGDYIRCGHGEIAIRGIDLEHEYAVDLDSGERNESGSGRKRELN